MSLVWNYFVKDKNGLQAKCNNCGTVISTKGGNTKGLHTHVQTKHKVNLLKRNNYAGNSTVETEKLDKKKELMTAYFGIDNEVPTLENILARMTAKDLIPFATFTTSEDLRLGLIARGFVVPKSANTIRELVLKYADKVLLSMTNTFMTKKKAGERFSCTLDEWTSGKCRRFLNINIVTFDHQIYNLGVIRIVGSFSSNDCLEAVKKRLNDFKLSYDEDIIATTTDGASVMMKFGRLSSTEHQLCYTHGIHLAVCDVLYAVNELRATSVTPENVLVDSDNCCEPEAESERLVFELDSKNQSRFIFKDGDVNDLVNKVRNIVRKINKSPVRNDLLQKYVKIEIGKELKLQLDVKTRWNSMVTMLRRFVQLSSPLKKVLIDIKAFNKFTITEYDIFIASCVVEALSPIEHVVEVLCTQKATLLTAHTSVHLAIEELERLDNEKNNELAGRLAIALRLRLVEREKIDLVTTMKLLNTGKVERCDQINVVKYVIISIAEKLKLGPYFIKPIAEEQLSVPADDIPLTFSEKLKKCLQDTKEQQQQPQVDVSLERVVGKEIEYFRATGEKGQTLKRVYEALCSIPPTSVESERAFSAAGLFSTKIRTRMQDRTLTGLTLLRQHFLSK